ncbi:MAG: ECF transporter S component [Ruminococcaceae bacterium]|nr:ECF transporter S component [Oscillospiraceae bacterium]
MKTKNNKLKLQKLTTAAVLAALSIVLMVTVRFPIFPATPFYEMEFADVPILICSWILGPVYALVSLLVVCVIQTLTVSSGSGIIGFLMHFLSSGLLIIILSLFKVKIRDCSGAKSLILRVVSASVGVIAVILVMIPMNIWLTSEFMGLPASEFFKAFLGYCVGFNAIKAGANVLIYNLLSPQLNKVYKKLFKI